MTKNKVHFSSQWSEQQHAKPHSKQT